MLSAVGYLLYYLPHTSEGVSIVIPILQVRECRHREVKELAQAHTAQFVGMLSQYAKVAGLTPGQGPRESTDRCMDRWKNRLMSLTLSLSKKNQ